MLTCAASPRYERSDDFPYGAPPGAVAETLAALDGDRWAFFHGLAQGVCASDPGPGVVEGLASIFKQTGPLVGDALAELATLDQRQRMAELDVPVLNVVGGKDAIVDPGIGRAAMEFLRKGRLCEFPECGHAPFLEAFPRYRDELLHFLADVE
ncbi:MAG: hypothetical protein KatS3mg124_0242 [Porticoccaceae bacterium]|nr:MAG: hypothetical protein KatS3mg124_0242 [Porticoccaceae bacterium]